MRYYQNKTRPIPKQENIDNAAKKLRRMAAQGVQPPVEDPSVATRMDVFDASLGTMQARMPTIYVDGVQNSSVKGMMVSGSVLNGKVDFPLTDGNGTALISSIIKKGCHFWCDDITAIWQFGNCVLSGDKKKLTVTCNKLVLALGVLNLTAAPNGLNVNAMIWGQ